MLPRANFLLTVEFIFPILKTDTDTCIALGEHVTVTSLKLCDIKLLTVTSQRSGDMTIADYAYEKLCFDSFKNIRIVSKNWGSLNL